jgi:hypothetical protein
MLDPFDVVDLDITLGCINSSEARFDVNRRLNAYPRKHSVIVQVLQRRKAVAGETM